MRGEREPADDGGEELQPGGDGEIEEVIEDAETDEAGEGDDAAADDETQEEPEEVAEPPRRRDRQGGESRFQRALRIAEESQSEARQLRDRLERLEQQRQQPIDPQAAAREEAEFIERLRLMDPVDAAMAVAARERQRFGQYLAQTQGQTSDRLDRSDFENAVRSDPILRRLQPEVERYVAQARAAGNFTISRMDIADVLYGREMRQKRMEAIPGQRRQGQRRIARETVRAGSPRGEATRERRQPADADEALLRGVRVGDL